MKVPLIDWAARFSAPFFFYSGVLYMMVPEAYALDEIKNLLWSLGR